MSSRRPRPEGRLPYVQEIVAADGRAYLYYRRDGRRTPLPGPEGSALFLDAYDRAHRAASAPRQDGPHAATVEAAITAYLAGADFAQLRPASQRSYRHTLDTFRASFGALPLAGLNVGWWEDLRAKYAGTGGAVAWNMLRSRMREVIRLHRRLRPQDEVPDPFHDVRRLRVERSDQNRPWPRAVLVAVLRAATPEFRALLIGYLLTAQRGGDVTRLGPEHYDPARRILRFTQEKTDEPLFLHAPDRLAAAIEAVAELHPGRGWLFVTPRGRRWTLGNAQETLARLLEHLGLPRYTLHGLRATGPTALSEEGVETRVGRALTGHTEDRSYEGYVRGAARYNLARLAQERLDDLFAGVVEEAEKGANRRRASGEGLGRRRKAPAG